MMAQVAEGRKTTGAPVAGQREDLPVYRKGYRRVAARRLHPRRQADLRKVEWGLMSRKTRRAVRSKPPWTQFRSHPFRDRRCLASDQGVDRQLVYRTVCPGK